jgi:hypothetical protein
MGNINNKNIHKFSDLENKKNQDEVFMICRTFNYCNLDNNYDVLITINMESKSIINKQNNSYSNNMSDKYLVKEYNNILETFVNNKNIQKNTIYIKAREYKSIPICYYYDDWHGTIKVNGLVILKNYKIRKKLIYDVIDINQCSKNFYDTYNHKYQNYQTNKIIAINNCIYVSFRYNNTKNETLYFGINLKSEDFGKQSNIYQIAPLKYFIKTFCFYNTNWIPNDNDLNWIVADNFFKEIYYGNMNFILKKYEFKIDVNIQDYPYNKLSIKF